MNHSAQKKTSLLGEELNEQRRLTCYELKDENGKIQKYGYWSDSKLAFAAGYNPSYLSRICSGEKIRINTAVLWNLSVALATAQVQAGICTPEEMLARARFIFTRLTLALVESESFEEQAEEFLADYTERRAIREQQDRMDRVAYGEKREDRKREKDSEKRRGAGDRGLVIASRTSKRNAAD